MPLTRFAIASFLFLVVAVFLQTPTRAEENPAIQQAPQKGLETRPTLAEEDPAIQQAAEKGLETLRGITNTDAFNQTYKIYGFDSPQQAADLQLGRPLRVRLLRLDSLLKFQPGSDPEKLLNPPEEVIYPITAKGEMRSSVTVTFIKNKNTWVASRWRNADLIKRLEQYNTSQSSFVVWVPSLYLHFLAFYPADSPGQLMLTPIVDFPKLKFEAGRPLPAQEVFFRLQTEAKSPKKKD